jgi:L-lysine 6-transaminase
MLNIFDISVDFVKSKKSYVHDSKTGEVFFDAFMMYSSLPLGYNHDIFCNEFKRIISEICPQKVSNTVFDSDYIKLFTKDLSRTAPLKNIHICTTGALAVESAIKSALFAHQGRRNLVLSLTNGFHGVNSWGFVTDNEASFAKRRLEFFPRLQWPVVSIDNLCEYLSCDANIVDIAAFIFEPIQCTAGDIQLPIDVLMKAREICRQNNICFIADEIQTGMGTTGAYWYSVQNKLDPDIIIFGKKCQVAGIMTSDQYGSIMRSPDQILAVTFDGDLIDVVRALYIFEAIRKYSLLDNIRIASNKISVVLKPLVNNYRAVGGLIAFDFDTNILRNQFVTKAYVNHLLVNPTGERSVRIRPHLAIDDAEVDDLIERVVRTISEINSPAPRGGEFNQE